MDLLERLNQLNEVHAPSGDEAQLGELLARLARPYGGEVRRDTLGNLIVRRQGSGPRVMFAAHMDSIGFIITHIEKEGFLRMGKLGGLSHRELLYHSFRLKNGVRGVLAREEKAELEKLKLEECYLDIGARDEEEARKLCQVGDTAVFDAPAFSQGDRLVSPYLDDRLSCAVLLQVLEELGETDNDLYFVFTVQEEVGVRGAGSAAFAIEPDYALVVDVTDVEDTPGTQRLGTTRLGRGAAIKRMDSDFICHPRMVSLLEETAREGEIPVQMDIMTDGGTDGGPIHRSRVGVLTGGVSIPCRYVHTPREMASLSDAQAAVRLLGAFARRKLPALEPERF